MRHSNFLRNRALAAEVVPVYPTANVSVMGGNSLVRRTSSNCFVSTINGHSIVRREANNCFASTITGHVLVRPSAGVTLTNRSLADSGSTSASASWQIKTGGTVEFGTGGVTQTGETWLVSGSAGDYEFRATTSSSTDALTSGTLNSWQDLGSVSPSYTWALSGGGEFYSATYTMEIRNASTQIVLASASIFVSLYTDGGSIPPFDGGTPTP